MAPALTTGFLFGEENVDANAGWIVPSELEYTNDSLKIVTKITNEMIPIGYDAVLWDIYQPLLDAIINIRRRYKLAALI